MVFVELDMKDEAMMMKLLPLYQTYESEISEEVLEEIFPPNNFDENFSYFKRYFSGKTTFICVADGEYGGFVTFHVDGDERRGYADGYEGWGHMSEIYTDRRLRGHGLGKAMVNKAEEELKKLGVRSIYLTDIADNDLFWKSLNYIDTGKIEPNEGGKIYEKHVNKV
ncbi:MAG: GNAT family N-acetyltransferase [Defluviitaleaceae bacterium]|nr:GNAT family N-acetyltransferase [Defluviitaleaceae bacterium]